MNLSTRPYMLSFRFFAAVVLIAAIALLWPNKAHAENNATSVTPVIDAAGFNKVVNKKTKKLMPCGKRCVDQKMKQIQTIMSKATTAPTGGLTRYTCSQVQAQVESILNDLNQRAPEVTVTFDQNWDDFPCTFVYYVPRIATK